MELQQLKYFKTVAEIGKISEAAEALFISAPALSTSISRLEKELGFTLFDRTNNKILLNQQGQIFLHYVNQILSNLSAAKREIRQCLLHDNMHISITCTNTTMWVNLISAFTSEFPQFTLSTSSITLSSLQENGLSALHSFFLAADNEIPPEISHELDSVFLFESLPAVMLHREHPLANRSSLSISDIIDERMFLPLPNGPLYRRLAKLFDLHNLTVPINNSYSFMVRLEMVKKNTGITFFSMHPDYTPLPNACYLPLEDPFGPWKIRLFWKKEHTLTQEESLFKDFVERYFHSLH